MRDDSPSMWRAKNKLPGAQASLVLTVEPLAEKCVAPAPRLLGGSSPTTANAAARGAAVARDPGEHRVCCFPMHTWQFASSHLIFKHIKRKMKKPGEGSELQLQKKKPTLKQINSLIISQYM